MVKRIVAAREMTPFRSLDDLDTRVRGIGPATIAALSPFLQFDRPETAPQPHRAAERRADVSISAAATPGVHLARTP
jgi:hypothetical protein